jgi:hypothetical protein
MALTNFASGRVMTKLTMQVEGSIGRRPGSRCNRALSTASRTAPGAGAPGTPRTAGPGGSSRTQDS